MIIETRIFKFYDEEYTSLIELAQAMGMSTNQLYRVREGSRHIDHQSIHYRR